jgi:hypothetical protein
MASDTKQRLISLAKRDPVQARATAITVAATAWGVLAVFLINLVSGALPLQLLDPDWQLKVMVLLMANVAFPLVAFMLFCLAPQIDPSLEPLRIWRQRSQALAVVAVLLFLLLIPLQTFATWRVIHQAETIQANQLRANMRQFRALQRAIEEAPTMGQLRYRLQVLDGPVLGRDDLERPLAQVRQRLLQALRLARINNRTQLATLPRDQVWSLVANAIQINCTSLVMAFCFAAGARRPSARQNLLLELQASWRRAILAMRRTRPTSRASKWRRGAEGPAGGSVDSLRTREDGSSNPSVR